MGGDAQSEETPRERFEAHSIRCENVEKPWFLQVCDTG